MKKKKTYLELHTKYNNKKQHENLAFEFHKIFFSIQTKLKKN